MATENTALPKLYIGIDIHKKSWSVHIRSDISDHKSFTVPADPAVVYDYVERNFPSYEVRFNLRGRLLWLQCSKIFYADGMGGYRGEPGRCANQQQVIPPENRYAGLP